MTLSPSNRYVKYTPVVLTSAFNVTFPIFDQADMKVFVGGIQTLLFSVTGTFSGGRSSDAQVVLVTAVTGVDVEIYGNRGPARTNNYLSNSPSLAENLQIDADILTAIQQEQARDFGRSIKVPVSEAGGAELPPAALRANKFLSFDALGNFILSLLGPTGAPVSPFMANTLLVANAAQLLASAGITSPAAALNILSGNGSSATITTDLLTLKDAAGAETLATFLLNGAFKAYYDNALKLETQATGAKVTGALSADTVAGAWIASQAEAIAATIATKIITPSVLQGFWDDHFTLSLGSDGFITFRMQGQNFKLQWVSYSLAAPASSTVSVAWPSPFANACRFAIPLSFGAAVNQIGLLGPLDRFNVGVVKGSSDTAARSGLVFGVGY